MKSRKNTVSLEDLLRIKRAEQPPPEFWSKFDVDLRAKQLAAIVEPRPWWAPLIRVGARLSHYQLPVSAAAILALSFVTVREYRGPQLSPAYSPAVATEEVAPTADNQEIPVSIPASVVALEVPHPVLSTELSAPRPVEALPELATETIQTAAIELAQANEREPRPSERYIAANLAAAKAADPGLMDDVFGPSFRGAASREQVRDPLAQVNGPGESRRSRLLGTALPVNASASDVAVGTSDRVARHLTEERLYDTITRVGLKGDRVAIKF